MEKEIALQKEVSEDLLTAFEKYYHNEVIIVEGNNDVHAGKKVNRKREEDFLEMVEEFHSTGIEKIAANEEKAITFSETWMEVTFREGHRVKLEQVSVKRWKGNQVIHERFYYKIPES